jgi:MoxR-like ATPase
MTVQAEATGGVAAERVERFLTRVRAIRQSLHEVMVGQDHAIDLLLTCA